MNLLERRVQDTRLQRVPIPRRLQNHRRPQQPHLIRLPIQRDEGSAVPLPRDIRAQPDRLTLRDLLVDCRRVPLRLSDRREPTRRWQVARESAPVREIPRLLRPLPLHRLDRLPRERVRRGHQRQILRITIRRQRIVMNHRRRRHGPGKTQRRLDHIRVLPHA